MIAAQIDHCKVVVVSGEWQRLSDQGIIINRKHIANLHLPGYEIYLTSTALCQKRTMKFYGFFWV
jgi:hypothetical protein